MGELAQGRPNAKLIDDPQSPTVFRVGVGSERLNWATAVPFCKCQQSQVAFSLRGPRCPPVLCWAFCSDKHKILTGPN